ncbi:TRAP transporter substrate-binding protein DctP [uncultured Massilia sp.]|uniref:TRAP transporter substrate-binding protein n=1 Tax=uncultured Massilia sp. TaxID=169973 RepID=UPI0025F6A91A|nr:TRAP transporter substrate-binding protein DctP [uncultured Massilia sp.]
MHPRHTTIAARRRGAMLAAATVAAMMAAAPAMAQDVTLRVADSLPSGHIIHQIATKPFLDAVARMSQGRIKLQHFPGEQLGKAKDLLMLTQAGVADIGYIGPSYQSDKMPLSSALELPGMIADDCQGARALWALTHDGGYLEKNEFAPNRVVPLLTMVLPPYQILLASGKKVATLKDLSGLKVRSAGGAMDFMVKSLDMVPVRMTPPEVYESLSRGTVDGAIFPYQSANSYGFANKIKTGTYKENFGTVVLTYSIGAMKWQQLPQATRAILMKAGQEVSLSACTRFKTAESEAFKKTTALGMKPLELGAADDQALSAIFARVATDWAASLDRRGKPGTPTLNAVRQALSSAK